MTLTHSSLPQRKLHRLKNWDYSQNGYYFATICTCGKKNLLASVGNAVPGVPPEKPQLTDIGKTAKQALEKLSQVKPNFRTDVFCIMPNHIHAIIIIENQEPDVSDTQHRGRRSLHDIVRGFKSVVTREFNKYAPPEQKNMLWQKSFYDEIIRNEQMLHEARNYIEYNHLKEYNGKLFNGRD